MRPHDQIDTLLSGEMRKYAAVYSHDPGYGHDCFGAQILPFIKALDFITVLDVGAGAGEFAGMLADLGKKVSTIDICPVAVSLASRDQRLHCMEGHIPGLEFDAMYDLITAFDVLEHVPAELVHEALVDLHEHCSKHVVLSVAWTTSRVCGLNLHPCVKNREWWTQQLKDVFSDVQIINDKPKSAGMFVYAR